MEYFTKLSRAQRSRFLMEQLIAVCENITVNKAAIKYMELCDTDEKLEKLMLQKMIKKI